MSATIYHVNASQHPPKHMLSVYLKRCTYICARVMQTRLNTNCKLQWLDYLDKCVCIFAFVLCKVNDMDAATSVRSDASSVLAGCGAEKKSSSSRGKCWSENRAAINDSCSIMYLMLNGEFCVFLCCRCFYFALLCHRAKWALFLEYWTLIITHIIDSELLSMFYTYSVH